MRRGLYLLVVPLAIATALPSAVLAQTRERVKITSVRLGLPVGPFTTDGSRRTIYKAGQWAPVYVDLECTRDTEEPLQILFEAHDADDAITEGAIEVAAMVKGDRRTANELGRIAYLKPGRVYAEVKVRVKGVESGRTYGESSDRTFQSVEGPAYVIAGIGYNLNGFRLPAEAGIRGDDNTGIARSALRGEWVETAQIIDVGMLPDHWFGYGAVDVMIIGTGADQKFWEALAEPQHEKRRKALVEWVRRGGRAIISVGANVDVLESLKEIKEMLPAVVPPGGKRMATVVPFQWPPGISNQRTERIGFRDAKNEFAVATLQPRADRPTRILIENTDTKQPLAIQGPYGQGRVTVVAFDLDRSPFSDWSARAMFWENLMTQGGYQLPPASLKFDKYGTRYDEYATALQGSLDYFEGVPVVSFGWVALFILIYIVLIGPLDYLFLKKVVKRLEWTWVTFPVIVITVSAGAYFAAYALKGRDLKINKLDVVDIDLAGKRMDGNTWFTLFSPRIHNYTIGVEPAGAVAGDSSAVKWTPADSSTAALNSVVSWQSNVERNRYGGSSGGGLFTKRYQYQSIVDPQDPNRDLYAAGLERVPIQVWTTKAFTSQWTAPLDPEKLPIVADLTEVGEQTLNGTITNNLPVDQFTDAALVWRGKVKALNGFAIGVPTPVNISAQAGSREQDLKIWVETANREWIPQAQRPEYYSSSSFDQGTTTKPVFRLWPILFAAAAPDSRVGPAPNATLRKLDQSWRVAADRPEQAMLVLRVATKETTAEEMTRSADSPSRLWLGDLPTSGKPRPAVQGTLKQETYIRVFIPVKTKK